MTVRPELRDCPACGKSFFAKSWNHTFCDNTCALNDAQRRFAEEEAVHERLHLGPAPGRKNRDGQRVVAQQIDAGRGGTQVFRGGRWVADDDGGDAFAALL